MRRGAIKIFPQTIGQLNNQIISDKAVCRTAPATPGLLNMPKRGCIKSFPSVIFVVAILSINKLGILAKLTFKRP